jgi:hypothetical protein
MPFCPNLSNPVVKREFDSLIKKHGENIAYYLWDKHQGVVPEDLVLNNTERVNQYFTSRFGANSVFIKDSLGRVENGIQLGYVENAAAYISRVAPMGTVYHEAFHLFFRTTLTDAQREQLYKDAVERYGEPSAEDIAKARSDIKEKISDQEARNLAIEEKMADEFRDYTMIQEAPKGLTGRIAKYFKDLLAYIKAIVGMPLTTKQAYRLLESNKVPAKFSRNATAFQGTSRANMIKKFAEFPEIHRELTRIGATLVVDSYDKMLNEIDPSDRKEFRKQSVARATQLMGNPRTKGDSEVRNYFLRLSVSTGSVSNPKMLTAEQFAEYRRLYDAANETEDFTEFDKFVDEEGIYFAPPGYDVNGNAVSKLFIGLKGEEAAQFSDHFTNVYNGWYDEELESGRKVAGFRTDIGILLREFGFNLNEKIGIEDQVGETERIYSVTRLEQDPGKTLSEKQRILLSRIPMDMSSNTYTGILTYVPAMEVYRAVLDTVTDSSNFTEMLNKLREKGTTVPAMREVYKFINNLPEDQQATLFYAFNTAYQSFMRVETLTQVEGKKKVVTSRIFSPNTGSVMKQVELEWRKASTLPGGLFKTRSGKGGFLVDQKKRDRIIELATKVGINPTTGKVLSSSLTTDQQAQLAEIMMLMGMQIAPTLEEAINRVQAVFGGTVAGETFRFRTFLNNAKIGELIAAINGKETVSSNPFQDESSTMKEVISKFVAPFETAKSQAFINSLMKSIYPINLKSRLNNEEKRVQTGELKDFISNTIQHDFGGATSILFKFLGNPKFTKGFTFETLEAFGEKEDEDIVNHVIEEMGFEEIFAARANAWYNQNKKQGFIAMDTAGDRKRAVFMPFPKLSLREVARQFGIPEGSIREVLLRDEMLLDLARMQFAIDDIIAYKKGDKVLGDLIEGYHYRVSNGKADFSRGSWTYFNTINKALEVDASGSVTDTAMKGLLVGVQQTLQEGTSKQLVQQDEEQLNLLLDEVEAAIQANTAKLARRLGAQVAEDGKLTQSIVTPLKTIISGGQTGSDRIGLEIAKELGYITGGTAAADYRIEGNKKDPSLQKFNLKAEGTYASRTIQNIEDSDGTVIFAQNVKSGGTALTIKVVEDRNKPLLINPTAEELREWVDTNEIKTLNVAGNRGSKMTEKFQDEIRDTLRAALGEREKNVETEVADGTIIIPKKSVAFSRLAAKVDNTAIGSDPVKFITDFAEASYIGRIVSRSMFRAGVNFTKNGGDYIKRAQLITTPGGQMLMKGDLPSNSEYGVSPKFNASTVRDIVMSLPEEDLAQFKERLVDVLGSEEAAERIVNSYRSIESTDAQAFISPKWYYEISQGKGEVDALFDEVYESYIDNGIWDPRVPVKAMKPSYDGSIKKESGGQQIVVPYSDKTSYITLTRELVDGIPVLEDLLDRMEAVGEYEGMPTIEVVHAISAQKLAIVPAHQVRFGPEAKGQFAELVVQEMDTQFLRFPEEVPLKSGKEEFALGHQAKVNMLTNLVREGTYVLNDGLDFATPIMGEDLENIFHGAVTEKLQRAQDKVHKELGYDKVLEAENEAERQAALEEFIPKLKERLSAMSEQKGFNEAVLDSLVSMPLGFPNMQPKFDQLLFSIYKNEVFKQKVKGVQMVQFADFGGRLKDKNIDPTLEENLRFLTVDGNRIAHAEVDIRADFLERIGIDPREIDKAQQTGDVTYLNEELRRVMGYRIPQQGKSSLLIMKIRRVLPKSHDGVIRVPPGITNSMGSDFDIDKMFIMFPELEVVETDAKGPKGSPQNKLINFLRDYGFEVRASENLIINLPQKNISLDTASVEQVAKALSEPLAEMLSYSEYFYIIEKEIRNTEKFKQRIRDLEEKYGEGGKRNLTRQAAKDIFKELLEGGFSERLAKELEVGPSLLQKIKQFVQDLIDSLKGADYGLIKEQIDTIVDNTFKGEDFIRLTKKEGYKQVDFQEAFDDNDIAKDIMTKIGTDPNIVLTGSIAYATQGTVFRKIETVVHDLDFVNLGSRESAKALLLRNYPESVEAYSFETSGYKTDTYLVPPAGFRVTDITRRPAGNKIIGFNIRNAEDEIVGTYKLDYEMSPMGTVINETEIKTGVEAMLVDFFTDSEIGSKNPILHPFVGSDGKTYNVKLAEYSVPFEAKLDFSRFKDIWDYNRFVPDRQKQQPTVRKLRVPYEELIKDPGKTWILSNEQINQIMFDTFEAIASSPMHVHETFSPLDGEDLARARDFLVETLNPEKEGQDIFSTVEAIDSTVRNMLSHRLRGVWADMVLGRNVLMGSQVDPELLTGMTLNIKTEERNVKSTKLERTALFNDVLGARRPTDYYMSLHLGAAVDSVKDPLQEDINDNVVTFKIETYLYSRGFTPAQVSIFLNHPDIRKVTDLARKNGASVSATLKESFNRLINNADVDEYELDFITMTEHIRQQGRGEYNRKNDVKFSRRLLQTLREINKEANDLYNLYSTITTFTVTDSGTTAQNLAIYDKVQYYLTKSSEGSIFGGKRLVSEILEGDAYGSSKAYWNAIKRGLQIGTDAGMLVNQTGYEMFRKALMEIGRGNPFREAGQKAMLNAVNHHLATKPGSPLFEKGFLDKTVVENLILSEDKEGSITYEFQRIKKILAKKNRFNGFIEALEPAQAKFPNEKQIDYLEYNNRKQRDLGEENAIIAGWEDLYFNLSGIFNEEEAAYAKQFAEHMLTVALVTTGFAPGPVSMMNILPPSILEDIGVGEHFTQQIEELNTNPIGLSDEFLENFMLHYGTSRYGNETFVQVKSAPALGLKKLQYRRANEETVPWDRSDRNVPPEFIYIKKVGLVRVTPSFYGDKSEGQITFTLMPKRSKVTGRNRLYEHNLRTEDGKVFDGSLVFDERDVIIRKPKNSGTNKSPRKGLQEQIDKLAEIVDDLGKQTGFTKDDFAENPTESPAPSEEDFNEAAGEVGLTNSELREELGEDTDQAEEGDEVLSMLDLTSKETPQGAEAKIARLRSSFIDAGVNFRVVLTSLRPGVKGMVQNGIITLDPSQMGEDTIYHEAGHILIDMMPEDEVRQYALQAERLRPDIAEMVRYEYRNEGLDEFGMLKEILVTAIGIEGAKIERKNPSKLQILINRVLRALGKLFGITPDAAAVLAEKMFAGDIKTLSLNKQFNPRIRQSRNLEGKIDKVFAEAYQSLERQIALIKRKPETLRTKAEILKIKQLQATLANISEKKESINGFFTFTEYVHEQVEIAKVKFEKFRKVKGRPVTREEALELLNEIDELNNTLSTFFNSKNRGQSLIDQVRNVVTQAVQEKGDMLLSIEVLRNLGDSISELEDLEAEFADVVAPIVVDAYASYMDSTINEKIDDLIKSVRANNDTTGMRYDLDYQDLEKRKGTIQAEAERQGLDPKEEWKNAVVELKVKKLQAKKLNRDNIIEELTQAQKDKSAFSLWLDPMVYSSEANLQMFAMALNEGNFNANRQSIALINDAVSRYEEYKELMGSDVNKSKFYNPLLKLVTVRQGDRTMKQLSLVQPYDTQKYYNNMYTFLDKLAKDTKRPDYDPTNPESKKEYEKWVSSKNGSEYSRRKAAWFARNTVPVKDAQQKLKALKAEKDLLITQKIEAEQQGKSAEAAVIQEYINELSTKIRMSYSKGTFMGELAEPKGWEGKPFESKRMYASEKYEKIQETPALKQMYDFLIETYKEKQKPYGQNNPQFVNLWDDFSYMAPTVRQSNIEAVGRMGLKGVITEAKDAFVRTDTDIELYGAALDSDGKPERFLPKYYTNAVDEKDVTRDILSSILMFSHRSNQYVERSKLTGLVNAMAELHKERRVIQKGEGGGTLLSREAVRFKEKFEDYAVDTTATTPGSASNTVNHLMQFIDSAFYGIHKKKVETKILGMDPTKLVGAANSLAALGSLSFNLLQIGNQKILDNSMILEEAIAGEFFSMKDLAWARGMYVKTGMGITDLGRFTPKSKLARTMMHFDALVEVTDSLGQDSSTNKFLKMFKMGNLLAGQATIEYQTAATRMLAAMKALEGKFVDKNGKVIKNDDGTDANLWDLMIETKNGVELDPRVDKEKSKFDEARFMAKLRGLYKRTNQVKGNFDASTLSRTPIGAFLMLFKNYFIPGFRKRWGYGDIYHRDLELGTMTRGMYQSVGGYFSTVYANGGAYRDVWENTSDVDKRNIRRAGTEFVMLLGTFIIYSGLMSFLDDEDEENYGAAFAAYQARRLQTELFAYINPGEAFRMFVSPMAAANRMQAWWDFISHLFLVELRYDVSDVWGGPSESLTKAAIYQRDSYWGEEGDRKIWGKLGKITPLIYGFSTTDTKTVEDKIRFFD